jgi:hypothetical protein
MDARMVAMNKGTFAGDRRDRRQESRESRGASTHMSEQISLTIEAKVLSQRKPISPTWTVSLPEQYAAWKAAQSNA